MLADQPHHFALREFTLALGQLPQKWHMPSAEIEKRLSVDLHSESSQLCCSFTVEEGKKQRDLKRAAGARYEKGALVLSDVLRSLPVRDLIGKQPDRDQIQQAWSVSCCSTEIVIPVGSRLWHEVFGR